MFKLERFAAIDSHRSKPMRYRFTHFTWKIRLPVLLPMGFPPGRFPDEHFEHPLVLGPCLEDHPKESPLIEPAMK